jgi:hypothetical protein
MNKSMHGFFNMLKIIVSSYVALVRELYILKVFGGSKEDNMGWT